MVGNSDESGWRRPPARRGISRSPPQWPQPVASLRTREGGFCHRKRIRYHRSLFCAPSAFENASRTQEAFLSTARIFGTREGPLRYRMPTTQPPSHHSTPSTPVPNATKPEMGKALPAANLSNCQKRGGHCKSAARNAAQGKPRPYFIANT